MTSYLCQCGYEAETGRGFRAHVQTALPTVQFKPGMGRQEKDSI